MAAVTNQATTVVAKGLEKGLGVVKMVRGKGSALEVVATIYRKDRRYSKF